MLSIVVRRAAYGVLLGAAPVMARAQCPDGTPPPCRSATRAAAPAANTVAVLYFENQSRDTADAYLAVGLTEAIISKLGEVPRLTVKSRYLVRRFQGAAQADPAEIGRSLGVTYIVTGGVQRAGTRLRVTTEMARAATGDRVWGQQYERGDGDVFAVQEDIARNVATGVAGRLLPAEAATIAARPTRNNTAYDDVLRGDVLLAQRTPPTVLQAIGQYEAATRLDPTLVSAWAKIGLAEALRLDWGWGDGRPPADSVLQRGMAAVGRALALDSSSSDAWMAHGYLLQFRNPRTWEGSEEAFRRAIALNPRNAEALQQLGDMLLLRRRGLPERERRDSLVAQTIMLYRAALEAEPGRPTTLRNLGTVLPVAQRMPLLDSAIGLDPGNFYHYWALATARRLLRDTAGARAAQLMMEQLAPEGARPLARSLRALGTLDNGDSVEARAMAARLLHDLGTSAPIEVRTGAYLFTALLRLRDSAAVSVLARLPRGSYTWAFARLDIVPAEILAANPALRQLVEENRPPWVPRP
jgi:TolB-like protein/Tfp pilus assembly protein PilF